MKVGLITIYQVPNYGSVLQAYATQTLIEQLGIKCDIINYKYPNEWHWQNGAIKPNVFRGFIRKILPSKKNKVLNHFRKHFFHLTRQFKSLDELKNADLDLYDAFIVGSDQVWNTRFVLGDSVFMLSFVPDNKPRYSIASSFAQKTLPEQFRDKYKRELSKFSSLSVREQNGINIIENELQINIPVQVILDPTLLLSKKQWLATIPRSNFKKTRPYILFYMWTYAFEPRPYIYEVLKYYQEKMNYDIIALEGYSSPECTCRIKMKDYSCATIPEFIDIFTNADLVITSSFHGTAFALNFGIPLISIIPDNNDDDRQLTLLNSLDCNQCAIKIGTNLSKIDPIYDVTSEQLLLSKIRNNSIHWIKNNIIEK